ncbi:Fanconi anemia-associated protein of 24 kDa [Trichinella pseudospiralis]|uniref:Fanconi anemia-associated protein of 24 kDa n=1 Tax=Trichinella pseudospiralis TaxID=6337 RepID=A0A0V1J5G1_TRIPS|nr:Fanconi anemia-associated protein of 24 kDa [Trichinella pseudospiralis]
MRVVTFNQWCTDIFQIKREISKRKRPFAAYFRNEKGLCDIEILPKYAAIYVSTHAQQLNDTRKKLVKFRHYLQRKTNVVGFVIIKRSDGDAENFQLIQKLCSVDMDIKVFPISHAEDVVNLIVELVGHKIELLLNQYWRCLFIFISLISTGLQCIHGDEKFTAYHQNIPSQSEIIKAVTRLPKVGKVKALALMERFGSIARLSNASVAEIAEIIGHSSAKKLKKFFMRSNYTTERNR